MRPNLLLALLFFLIVFSSAAHALDAWFNASWHYRVRLDVNSTGSVRLNWPVEHELNFTALFSQKGFAGTLDNNSVRVYEYNGTGAAIRETPSQFDAQAAYNSSHNAVGTLAFIMNGTTAANAKRIYYAYFDATENGAKPAPSYGTTLNYSRVGDEFNVNNSQMRFYVDSRRGENSSGLYRVQGNAGVDVFSAADAARTIEFQRYSNGTHNFSFDFYNNITVVHSGPARIVVEMRGNETYYDRWDGKTGEGLMVKRYIFYENASWLRITQNYTNNGAAAITRNSTNATALALDPLNAFGSNYQHNLNASSPAPWAWCAPQFGGSDTAIISIRQVGTQNFSISNNPLGGVIGITLGTSTIGQGSTIYHDAALRFNDTEANDNTLQNLSIALGVPQSSAESQAEAWNVTVLAQANYSTYNRGEAALVRANVVSDIYSLVTAANATVDNGTPSDAGDDINLTLYDDGTHGDVTAQDKLFSNNFTLANNSILGTWNITVRVFNGTTLLLANNHSTFTVTDAYNVSVSVLNDFGLVSRQVNATVVAQNFRRDSYISGASVSCSFNSTTLSASNITSYGNGTYLASFNAIANPGTFLLVCNATKFSNFGNSTDLFQSESFLTNVTTNATPNNVTVFNVTLTINRTFTTTINATNTGNATAYYANISVQLPSGWGANATLSQCGNINTSSYCLKALAITVVANATPGIYTANFTALWINADGSNYSNTTTVYVNVTTNPLFTTFPANLTAFIPPGAQRFIGNFTINSTGNDGVLNITYNSSGFPYFTFNFTPANYSPLGPGAFLNVSVNVTVPASFPTGNYDGFINVTTANAGNFSFPVRIIVSGTNLTINASPAYVAVNNVTVYANATFPLVVNATNPGNVTAQAANISLSIPSGWAANATLVQCGSLSSGQYCTATINVTVANGTLAGNYTVNATALWVDPEIGARSNTTTAVVNVSSTRILNTTESNISGTMQHNTSGIFANFTLRSDGSDSLLNLTYNITGFPFPVILTDNASNMSGSSTRLVYVNATIPFAFDAGTYNGSLNISSANAESHNISIEITVAANRSWTLNQTACTKLQVPEAGTACVVRVNNTGNAEINFSVTPAGANQTNASNTSFVLARQTGLELAFTYNVTGVIKLDRNTTYFINTTPPGNPTDASILIMLTSVRTLNATTKITPNLTQASNPVLVEVNVTDENGAGILYVTVNVTNPLGNFSLMNITFSNSTLSGNLNISIWRGYFNATNFTGNYTATALAFDPFSANGTAKANFTTFARFNSELFTLKDTYVAGSTASIYYRSRDYANVDLGPTNVTLAVRDNSSRVIYSSTLTGVRGLAEPLPQFTISSDQGEGNYTLYSNSTYFDVLGNATANETKNYSFKVVAASSSSGNIDVDVSTLDYWSDGDNSSFVVTVKYANGTLLNPETLNLTVFGESALFSVSKASLTNSSDGLYRYYFAMPANVTPGVYFAEANASHQGQRARALAIFRIKASLLAQVDTTVVWYPQSVMTFSMLVQDAEGKPVDASSMNLTVFDPADNVYFTVTIANITRKDTGFYTFKYSMPLTTSVGAYLAVLNVSAKNRTTRALKPFRVSAGGPFDVLIDIPKPETTPGSYLDFKVTLKNMGDVSQDVTVEYWTSDGTRTWFSASEAVYVASQGTTEFNRNAYIFSSQGLGSYTLNVRVTYDPVKPPIDANKTFTVKAPSGSGTTSGGSGSSGGTTGTSGSTTSTGGAAATPLPLPAQDLSNLRIVEYPDEILVERGDSKFPKIVVKNTGLGALHNLQLIVSGIPSSWVEIQPGRVNVLASGDEETFVLRISVPVSTPASVRPIRFIAVSDEKKDDVASQIAIFESRVALVEYELDALEKKIAKLSKEAREAELLGKDVNDVWRIIGEARNYTEAAKSNLRDELVDDALGNLGVAEVMLSKATGLLITSSVDAGTLQTGVAPVVVLLIIVFTILATFAGHYIYRHRRKIEKAVPEAIKAENEKVIEILRVRTTEELSEEKERILRVFDLLEEEVKNGAISRTAYTELRKRNETRLGQVQKMLREKSGEGASK